MYDRKLRPIERTQNPTAQRKVSVHLFHAGKEDRRGAPCGRAEGVYIAMGIRVFGVRGSNGTSTEKGITVAFSGNSFRSFGGRNPEKQEE